MAKSVGRCGTCKRVITLRKDHTIRAHGWDAFYSTWCAGSGEQPLYQVGDQVESTLNGTRAEVVRVAKVEYVEPFGWRQLLFCRKTAHGEREGWAAIGEMFPESNRLANLVVPV